MRGALQGQEWCFLADVLAFLVCDRLERCLQAIDRVAALAGPEPLGGIVDGHVAWPVPWLARSR